MLKPINKSVYGVFPPEEPRKNGLILLPENEINKSVLIIAAVSNDIDDIQVGQKILIKKYAGTEVSGEVPGLIVDYDDILAVFE